MCLPGDGRLIVRPRLPASFLIVEENVMTFREVEHLRKEIIMVCAGAAVENNEWIFSSGAIPCPIELRRRRLC